MCNNKVGMTNKARIESILTSYSLDEQITGFTTFQLNQLELEEEINFILPTNLRLGHLAEKVISQAIRASGNYKMLHENVQVKEGKVTIGELDFILQNSKTDKILHLEIAYKFYLFDPSISSNDFENWVGPNRNDSLAKKLQKLKSRQFPLLNHPATHSTLPHLNCEHISQALCLITSLYLPFGYKRQIDPQYQKAVRGYYTGIEYFKIQHNPKKTYQIPSRKEWGIDPCENKNWFALDEVLESIELSIANKQCSLIWQKEENTYSEFFVIWW